MKKLNVGDRVAVYQGNALDRCFKNGREVGKVIALEFGMIRVQLDGYSWHAYSYHPNQVRRLVKRKRREFWLRFNELKQPEACAPEPLSKRHETDEIIHVREIGRRK